MTTAWDQLSTSVSVTPLNISDEFLRRFPDGFVATKTGLFNEVCVCVVFKKQIFLRGSQNISSCVLR